MLDLNPFFGILRRCGSQAVEVVEAADPRPPQAEEREEVAAMQFLSRILLSGDFNATSGDLNAPSAIRIGDYLLGSIEDFIETLADEPRRNPASSEVVAALPRLQVQPKHQETEGDR